VRMSHKSDKKSTIQTMIDISGCQRKDLVKAMSLGCGNHFQQTTDALP